MDDMCGVCRTNAGGSQRKRHMSCGVYVGAPASSTGSVHSTPRWHPALHKAALLCRGCLPRYHAGAPAQRWAAPRPPAASHAGGLPHMPRMRVASPGCCCGAGCACAALCAACRHVTMASRSRCHNLWRGVLGAHARRSVHQKQVCAVGWPCLPRQGPTGSRQPCHHRSCDWASQEDVSERGWHRTATGMRTNVLSSRAPRRPAQECPDVQLAMQDAPSEDALAPAPHPCAWLVRSPVMRVPWLRLRSLLLVLGCCTT